MAALTQAEVTFGNVDRQGDLVRLEWEALGRSHWEDLALAC